MNLKHYIHCILAGLLVSAALLLGLVAGSARRPAAATEAVPVRIELEIVATYPDGLALAWSDPSGYRGGYELIGDATGEAVMSFGAGATAGTVSGLACGKVHRFWLISADGRDSNTIAGQTGPCGEVTR